TYIDQTGYSLKRLYDQLAKLPAARVVVVLDSCFSGGGSRSVIARGARPLVTVTLQAVPSNLTVISASGGNQVSNSYEAKGHGLFTYFLLKGLKEKGDDLRAVFDYLKPEVSRAARREHNADQEPQWSEGR
ncbi:MAG: caspase family protein, partial [Elusimicrobia bacterium]|nr:caspase family protein [Elusimicrobiota bacterium]